MLGIAEAQLILCKDNANRAQSSSLGIAEVQLILCKDNANRAQSSSLGITEVQLILCKDNDNYSFCQEIFGKSDIKMYIGVKA
mgnify:CR=1 FL=1